MTWKEFFSSHLFSFTLCCTHSITIDIQWCSVFGQNSTSTCQLTHTHTHTQSKCAHIPNRTYNIHKQLRSVDVSMAHTQIILINTFCQHFYECSATKSLVYVHPYLIFTKFATTILGWLGLEKVKMRWKIEKKTAQRKRENEVEDGVCAKISYFIWHELRWFGFR